VYVSIQIRHKNNWGFLPMATRDRISAPAKTRRRPGRPAKPPEELRSATMTFRIRPELRTKLVESAAANNRSPSDEVAHRVVRTVLQDSETQAFSWILDAKAPGSEPSEALETMLAGSYSKSVTVRAAAPVPKTATTEERICWYIANYGDPLARAVEIAALRILTVGVLDGLADRLGCSRFQAAMWWRDILVTTLPFIHAPLATVEEGAQQ
jgi:hypothetical protein